MQVHDYPQDFHFTNNAESLRGPLHNDIWDAIAAQIHSREIEIWEHHVEIGCFVQHRIVRPDP